MKYHAGSLLEARQCLERALSFADVPLPPLSTDIRAVALGYLALVLIHQGHADQGLARIEEATSRATALERPYDRNLVALIACFVYLTLHDIPGLVGAADQAATLDDFPAVAAVGRLSRGRVLSARGDHGRAIAMMREAIDSYRAIGQRIALPVMLAMLAEGHAAAGETSAGLACVAEARANVESSGEIRHLAELHRLEGTLHAAGKDRSAAERCFRDAVAIAREQGERLWELRAVTTWARMALQTGTRGAARGGIREDLERLLASFDGGAGIPDLCDAQLVLAALRGDRVL